MSAYKYIGDLCGIILHVYMACVCNFYSISFPFLLTKKVTNAMSELLPVEDRKITVSLASLRNGDIVDFGKTELE